MICVRNQPRSQFGADVGAAINFSGGRGKLGKAASEGGGVFLRPFSKLWVLEKDTAETAAAAADDFAYYAHLIYDPC